jgi:hypothetical protein
MMRLAGALLAIVCAGCAGPAANAPRADAGIIVAVRCAQPGADCAVPDARVYVDDKFVGRAIDLGDQPIPVQAGSRRVEVRADGWFTSYREVPVARSARAKVDVPMRKVPDGEAE